MFHVKPSKRAKRFRVITLLIWGALIAGSVLLFCDRLIVSRHLSSVTDYEVSPQVFDRNGELLYRSLSPSDEWCLPISLDHMGRWTAEVAVAIEDKRFYSHSGVDYFAIARAAKTNIAHGSVVSGASTITSQLVRVSLPRKRTIRTKLFEFWEATRIEKVLTKDQILELYLNKASFGGNIRGVEAAARAYFDKPAEALSLGESVLLVSMLRAPSALRPDRYPERAQRARDRNLHYLSEQKIISRDRALLAQEEQVIAKRYGMRHGARFVFNRLREQVPQISNAKSTIDVRIQTQLDRRLREALAIFNDRVTAAGIVVENKTGNVLAYVGNARYGEGTPASEVDCGTALRSPGSTLKPFVYLQAFEDGRLTPAALLADTPISFRGNAPRNYDLQYRGPVSARLALANSLNVPAVRVLREVGYARTLAFYRLLGFEHLQKQSTHYYDSLVLGGCEVTLLELAGAYRTIASGGLRKALNWHDNPPFVSSPVRLSSPEAVYMLTDILSDTHRFSPILQDVLFEEKSKVAFKTGTSYGLRDAWSAGYNEHYTIIIWFGVHEGYGDGKLVGLEIATPVMLHIFRDIARPVRGLNTPPAGIYYRKVCALSGALPTAACAHRREDMAIRDVSPSRPCTLHRQIDGQMVTVWPKELRDALPTFHARMSEKRKPPRINSPLEGANIFLPAASTLIRQHLQADAKTPMYWFLDGKPIGVDSSGKGLFVDVEEGVHSVTVLSEGLTQTCRFNVIPAQTFFREMTEDKGNVLNE